MILQKIPKLPLVQGHLGRKMQERLQAQSPTPFPTPGSLTCGDTQDFKQMGAGAAEPKFSWEYTGTHGSCAHAALRAADPPT